MKRHWWKILTVILLVYVITAGLLIPLGPGIYSTSPQVAEPDRHLTLTAKGYHTNFRQAEESMQAVLQDYYTVDSISICAESIKVVDEETVELRFDVHSGYIKDGAARTFDLLLNNDLDGTLVFPSALVLNPSQTKAVDTAAGGGLVQNCKIVVQHNASSTFSYPFRNILYESIRNLFFHVPMWFTMMLLYAISLFYSIKYLRKQDIRDDMKAVQYVNTGLLFTVFGLLTGMLWARFTWGQWWVFEDAKLNGAAILALEYFAYVILRSSMEDETSRARVSAVYNIFAAASIIPLLYIYPNIYQGLHPANGGNAGFSNYDLDNRLRSVFYPAILGFMGLGLWIAHLRIRYKKAEYEVFEEK